MFDFVYKQFPQMKKKLSSGSGSGSDNANRTETVTQRLTSKGQEMSEKNCGVSNFTEIRICCCTYATYATITCPIVE